jgi:long-chain fatty acid transport protein
MKLHSVLRATGLLAPLIFAVEAGATNGYYSHGIGTHNKAQAGAGSAAPTMSIDIANNPAAAALVDPRWDVGLGFFSPDRNYETGDSLANGQGGAFTIGPNDIDSSNDWFAIPYVAKVWKLDNEQALGFAFYGRGGMNTEWRGGTATFDPDGPGPAPVMTLPGTYGDGKAGVNLMQGFIELAWAGSIGDFHWGITPMLAVQAFEAQGIGTFAGYTETFARSGGTQFPKNLSDNGHEYSWGYGIKLGGIWQATETISLALAYQSKMNMTELDDYADLFAESGGFDMPAFTRGGISWRPSSNLGLHFDIEHIQYSDVDSVGNPIQDLFSCPTAGPGGTNFNKCLGGSKGAGFGWDDMTIYKLGVNWTMGSLPEYTFRAGYSYGDQPIPDDQMTFNILAPAVMEDHFTFGVNRERSNGHEISMSLMYAPEQTLKGNNNFDPTQKVEFSMSQFEIEFAYSW